MPPKDGYQQGFDLLELCLKGPESKLEETRYCQPAMYVAGLAGLEKLRKDKKDHHGNGSSIPLVEVSVQWSFLYLPIGCRSFLAGQPPTVEASLPLKNTILGNHDLLPMQPYLLGSLNCVLAWSARGFVLCGKYRSFLSAFVDYSVSHSKQTWLNTMTCEKRKHMLPDSNLRLLVNLPDTCMRCFLSQCFLLSSRFLPVFFT